MITIRSDDHGFRGSTSPQPPMMRAAPGPRRRWRHPVPLLRTIVGDGCSWALMLMDEKHSSLSRSLRKNTHDADERDHRSHRDISNT